jgi:hypothetical protein
MEILERKYMEKTEAILKIIIGIISLGIIVGIFLILDGVKQKKRIEKNNSLNPVALQIIQSTIVNVNDFDGINITIKLDSIKCIRVSNLDLLSYLIYEGNGAENIICLGYIEANVIRKFNNLLNS